MSSMTTVWLPQWVAGHSTTMGRGRIARRVVGRARGVVMRRGGRVGVSSATGRGGGRGSRLGRRLARRPRGSRGVGAGEVELADLFDGHSMVQGGGIGVDAFGGFGAAGADELGALRADSPSLLRGEESAATRRSA